ncbi:hypothetical protein SAMD00019534_085930 [Acytostelium subglobosum LB1]|uniref:hypothetical protein n=1 Tax=Acytostelium subglobosum LB1 TaxID=1410327 RepID=UPI00064522E1|nr:hypothetical protein SAMD00019534_085930 [Acytostelium subglobosum LB1]GAM25418.1 hypothetical protein SAMD00019534_085930 [Acytostelium subglobosum LB1]|eukprot:XP_012751404.1 hypothetical protein SAMD00019534_085930 [Acytostelium subglobosum LB1]
MVHIKIESSLDNTSTMLNTYQSLQETNVEITSHFEQLIKVIMAQEHRVKTPINQQISHVQSTINDIIDEIKQINRINNHHVSNIEMTSDNNNDNGATEDITQLIQTITSCTSIDEFTKSVLGSRYGSGGVINDDNNSQQYDHELLSMISHHSNHMKMTPYDELP